MVDNDLHLWNAGKTMQTCEIIEVAQDKFMLVTQETTGKFGLASILPPPMKLAQLHGTAWMWC